MKRLIPALLALLCIPGGLFLVQYARAKSRIAAARAETADLPGWLEPVSDVGFDLRHPAFGVFGNPPPLDVDQMMKDLAAVRKPEPQGFGRALERLAEERRFLVRLDAMRSLSQISEADLEQVRLRLRTLPPRPPTDDLLRGERLLLIRAILLDNPDLPTGEEAPRLRDGWSTDLLRARKLEDLDALYDALRSGAPPPADSSLALWISAVAAHVLELDAELRSGFDKLR